MGGLKGAGVPKAKKSKHISLEQALTLVNEGAPELTTPTETVEEVVEATPEPASQLPAVKKRNRNLPNAPGPGRPAFSQKDLATFNKLSKAEQKKVNDEQWMTAAYILAERMKRFGLTATAKEFGRLQQIATTAGIARDKLFPKPEPDKSPVQQNFLIQLFGTVGLEQMFRAVMNQAPVIDVTATDVNPSTSIEQKDTANGPSGQG